MRGLNTGSLDRRITISRVEVQNVRGIAKKAPVIIANSIAAKYRQLKSEERYGQESTTANADFEFVIRWSKATSEIRPKDQIEFVGGNGITPLIYEIIGLPAEIGRREYLSIKARLQDANA